MKETRVTHKLRGHIIKMINVTIESEHLLQDRRAMISHHIKIWINRTLNNYCINRRRNPTAPRDDTVAFVTVHHSFRISSCLQKSTQSRVGLLFKRTSMRRRRMMKMSLWIGEETIVSKSNRISLDWRDE
jgi:hypothetical protein